MTSHSKLLNVKEVAEWLDVSESAIYKWVNEGTFPEPYKFGSGDFNRKTSRWKREEIEEWLDDKRP